MMEKKTSQLKRAIEQKKQLKEHDQLSELIAQKVGSEFGLHLKKNAEILGLLARLLEEVEKRIAENKISLPEIQSVRGDVNILNHEDFKTEIQKVRVENPVPEIQKVSVTNPISEVTVKNQLDLKEFRGDVNRVFKKIVEVTSRGHINDRQSLLVLRKDINQILKAINDVFTTERIKNKQLLGEFRGYLERLTKKQDSELLDALKPLRLLSRDSMKPLSVRLSDGEKFYKALAGLSQAFYAASNTKKVEDLLQEIANNTDTLEVTLGDVDLNTDELEAKLESIKTKLDTLNAIDFSTETTLALLKNIADAIKSQTDKLTFITDRLKVDATVTGITVITDIRSLIQKFSDQNQMFMTTVRNVTISGQVETDFFLLKNPAGSGRVLKIKDIIILTAKSVKPVEVGVYLSPTITADGTVLSINNFRDRTVPATAQAFKTPTIANRGTLFELFAIAGGSELRHEEFLSLQLLEDEELLITVDPDQNNEVISIDVSFAEIIEA